MSDPVSTAPPDAPAEIVPTVRLTSILGAVSAPEPGPDRGLPRGLPDLRRRHRPACRAAPLGSSGASRCGSRRADPPSATPSGRSCPSPRLTSAPRRWRMRSRPAGPGVVRASRAPADELATVLHAAYGVTRSNRRHPQALRTVPSGGALYPSSSTSSAAASRARPGPLPLRPAAARSGAPAAARSSTGSSCALRQSVRRERRCRGHDRVFWRSRFKYGARAYRFTLLEAGHVGQNLLLAATALGLASVPIGGFFDREVDAFLGVDGLHEASLYLFPLGGRAMKTARPADSLWAAVASGLSWSLRASSRSTTRSPAPATRSRPAASRAAAASLFARPSHAIAAPLLRACPESGCGAKRDPRREVGRGGGALAGLRSRRTCAAARPAGALASSTAFFAAAHVRDSWPAPSTTSRRARLSAWRTSSTGRLVAAVAAHCSYNLLVGAATLAERDMSIADTGRDATGLLASDSPILRPDVRPDHPTRASSVVALLEGAASPSPR